MFDAHLDGVIKEVTEGNVVRGAKNREVWKRATSGKIVNE